MRVFLMGATKFSRRCLDAVLESGQEFCGCAATPEHFDISYAPEGVRNVNYCNFVEVAGEFGVPCIAYDRKNVNSFVDEVRELQPDLCSSQAGTTSCRRNSAMSRPKGPSVCMEVYCRSFVAVRRWCGP